MITSTPSLTRDPARGGRRRRGFTLVEVMVAAALASFILAGVLSSFLFMARSGANLQNYTDMEIQARRALEEFAEDVRQASAINWSSSTAVVLTVNSASVAYYLDSSSRSFIRQTATTKQAIVTGVSAGSFEFKAYNVTGSELPLATPSDLAAATSTTKQLQISMQASRTTQTVIGASNLVLSARFILRNKVVTA